MPFPVSNVSVLSVNVCYVSVYQMLPRQCSEAVLLLVQTTKHEASFKCLTIYAV